MISGRKNIYLLCPKEAKGFKGYAPLKNRNELTATTAFFYYFV